MKTIYQKNIDAFESRYSQKIEDLFKQEWKKNTENEILISSNSTGLPNIYFNNSVDQVALFNEINPYQDIKDSFNDFKGESVSHVVTLGINFGFLVSELMQMHPQIASIVIIEPEVEILKKQLEIINLSEIILNKKVHFIIGKKPFECAEITGLLNNISAADMKEWSFLLLNNSIILYSEYMKLFSGYFQTTMSRQKLQQSTIGLLGIKFISNYINNLPIISQSIYANELEDLHKGKPIIIVSAGPSLTKQLPLLHKIQNNVAIIAVGAALKSLSKFEIHPHFVISIDPLEKNINYFKDFKFTREILVAPIVSASNVVNFFPGKVVLSQFSPKFDIECEKYFGKIGYLESGGSVANSAYSLAKLLGASEIIFIGQDLAHTEGQSHVGDHLDFKITTSTELSSNENLIKIKGFYGDTVYAPATLDSFRSWFEYHIKKDSDIQVRNCTEGGAYIEGAIHSSFADFVSTINNDEIISINIINVSNKPTIKVIKAILQSDLKELQNVNSNLKNAVSSLKILKNIDDTSSGKAIKALKKIRSYLIKSDKESSPYINILWSNALSELSKLEKGDDDSDNENNETIIYLKKFIPIFEILSSYCNENIQSIYGVVRGLK